MWNDCLGKGKTLPVLNQSKVLGKGMGGRTIRGVLSLPHPWSHTLANPSRADLEGPQIYNLFFISCHGRSQNHKMSTNETKTWSPGLTFDANCTIVRAGAVPGAPHGPAVGPEGAKIGQKPGAIFSILSCPGKPAEREVGGESEGPSPVCPYHKSCLPHVRWLRCQGP